MATHSVLACYLPRRLRLVVFLDIVCVCLCVHVLGEGWWRGHIQQWSYEQRNYSKRFRATSFRQLTINLERFTTLNFIPLTHGYSQCPCLLSSETAQVGCLPGHCVCVSVCARVGWGMVEGSYTTVVIWTKKKVQSNQLETTHYKPWDFIPLRWRHSYGKKFFHKICDSYFCTHEL